MSITNKLKKYNNDFGTIASTYGVIIMCTTIVFTITHMNLNKTKV